MLETIPLSTLGAVNMALDTIGEEPIAVLDFTGASDAATAYRSLINTSRSVQEYGYTFNKEYDYPLVPNTEGRIEVPSNTLFVDPGPIYVQRGNCLYDRQKHSYNIPKRVLVEIIFMLPFEELPSYARSYIAIRAARRFQKGILGSDSLDRSTEEIEGKALAVMNSREIAAGAYNYLDAPDMMAARRRVP